jgi:polar amino acid transport system substrate-binding protein
MRRIMIAAAVAAIFTTLAACGSTGSSSTQAAPSTSASVASCSKAAISKLTYQPGVLTVATDKPVYPPWFAGNNPANGKGYESAVAYAVAAQLGFSKSQVKWVYEPFNNSYAPGPKKFDFDIN